MTVITSRAAIARLADDAASLWVRFPDRDKPLNPFDPIAEPEHHRAWAASFERALLLHSCQECEGGA